ncbi:hypothetical protein, partial [Pseudomonas viridiflava]|uniref:hypothetical protein n=1 Tax=Pseudomonas viridiflava TaxID=33069 RepID=UPI001980FB05
LVTAQRSPVFVEMFMSCGPVHSKRCCLIALVPLIALLISNAVFGRIDSQQRNSKQQTTDDIAHLY